MRQEGESRKLISTSRVEEPKILDSGRSVKAVRGNNCTRPRTSARRFHKVLLLFKKGGQFSPTPYKC